MQKNKLCIDCNERKPYTYHGCKRQSCNKRCLRCTHLRDRNKRRRLLTENLVPYCRNHPDKLVYVAVWIHNGQLRCIKCVKLKWKNKCKKQLAAGFIPSCKNHPDKPGMLSYWLNNHKKLCSSCYNNKPYRKRQRAKQYKRMKESGLKSLYNSYFNGKRRIRENKI